MFGFANLTPVYDYTVTWPPFGGVSTVEHTRLHVRDAITYGIFAEARVRGLWHVIVEAGEAATSYRYSHRMIGLGESSDNAAGTAMLGVFSARIGRQVPLPLAGTTLAVSLGGAMHTVDVRSMVACPSGPQPPSAGGPIYLDPVLCGYAPWQRWFNAPTAITTVGLQRRFFDKLHIQIDGGFAAGRIRTSAFWTDLVQAFDPYEAKKTQGVRATHVRIRLGKSL
jgi:hypothetical protein